MKILVTGGSGFIGTHLIGELLDKKIECINIDMSPPKIVEHVKYWYKCDILDKASLIKIFEKFRPTHIIHLAARADVNGKTLDDYRMNTDGTTNLIETIKLFKEVERVIITSSQFVHQYNGMPSDDEDFSPHTIYGESKVITEKITKNAGLTCCWTIIRPTNIWGAWHWRYAEEFWKIVGEGKYLHPSGSTIRSYGYVKNIIWQMIKILESDIKNVNKKVFYVGDKPIELYEWANTFSKYQLGRNVRVIPRCFLFGIALLGDILKLVNVKFPLTLSRYKSMTVGNPAPMEKIFHLCGNPPYSLDDGVKETVEWLKREHPELVKV